MALSRTHQELPPPPLFETTFAVCLMLAIPHYATVGETLDDAAMDQMHRQFSEAHNRGDLDTMAATFAKDAVRVTPSGTFQGRDAIRGSFSDALKLGLHDYSVQRTISRPEGAFVLNAGTWQAKVGDRSFHGYYSSILTSQGGQPEIIEETVVVAAP